jgi:hypothetical protein
MGGCWDGLFVVFGERHGLGRTVGVVLCRHTLEPRWSRHAAAHGWLEMRVLVSPDVGERKPFTDRHATYLSRCLRPDANARTRLVTCTSSVSLHRVVTDQHATESVEM